MPLDLPLFGGIETPVDQVDEDITLEIGAFHKTFHFQLCHSTVNCQPSTFNFPGEI